MRLRQIFAPLAILTATALATGCTPQQAANYLNGRSTERARVLVYTENDTPPCRVTVDGFDGESDDLCDPYNVETAGQNQLVTCYYTDDHDGDGNPELYSYETGAGEVAQYGCPAG